jgi:tetratricopeptide (TPR) repeat protein
MREQACCIFAKELRPYAAMALLLLAACSGNLQHKQLAVTAAGLPQVQELSATPFYPQEIHHCGPAALATAVAAAGGNTNPAQLAQLVYLPGREGSLAVELIAATRNLGYLPYQLQPSLTDLLAEIAQGRPVMVLQNLGLAWLPRWHYAVAIGYDLRHDQIILRSGSQPRVLTNLATFERTWRRGDYWALLVLPPGEMPARANISRYLQATVGLERSSQSSAHKSYRAAVKHWPENLTAWMSFGNSSYAAGDLDAATQAYRQAISLDGRYAPAYNNLAQTLADRKQWNEAERMARHALEIGGTHLEVYRATLEDILKNKAAH